MSDSLTAREVFKIDEDAIIWEDSRWLCAHCSPAPLVGWLMFYSQRHVQGPAHFNADERVNFGLAVGHIEEKMLEITGALRAYTVAFGESVPHLHAHLIPRYEGAAPGATDDKPFEGYVSRRTRAPLRPRPVLDRLASPWRSDCFHPHGAGIRHR